MKNVRFFSFMVLLLAVYFFIIPPTVLTRDSSNRSCRDPDNIKESGILSQILKQTADYCKRLEEVSIYYFCKEEVKETIYPLPKRYRGHRSSYFGIHSEFSRFLNKPSIMNNYLYDYQMIRKGKKVRERRTLLLENGKEKNKKKARLKTHCFKYTTIVYGPIVFDEDEQRFYLFKTLRKEKWEERNVLVIKVLPKLMVQKPLIWGEFWVDEKHHNILKIEMSQRSIQNYYKIERIARLLHVEPRIKILMEYGIEKNGIRFPSKFSIEETYIDSNGEKFKLSEIVVNYRDYKFFTVGVDVRYQDSH